MAITNRELLQMGSRFWSAVATVLQGACNACQRGVAWPAFVQWAAAAKMLALGEEDRTRTKKRITETGQEHEALLQQMIALEQEMAASKAAHQIALNKVSEA